MSPSQAPHEIAAEAIRLFQKYRDMHGDEAVAKIQAVSDFIDAEPGECEPKLPPKRDYAFDMRRGMGLKETDGNRRSMERALKYVQEMKPAGYTAEEIRVFHRIPKTSILARCLLFAWDHWFCEMIDYGPCEAIKEAT